MAYVTLTEAKTFLLGSALDAVDDANLTFALNAAEALIDNYTNRHFDERTETRTFQSTCASELIVSDLLTVTTLKSDDDDDGTYETTWTVTTDYVLERSKSTHPYTAVRAVGTQPFPTLRNGRFDVQIVGTWGWPDIPAPVKAATLMLTTQLFKRKDSPYGVLGGSDFGAVRISSVDRDVEALLNPYVRRAFA